MKVVRQLFQIGIAGFVQMLIPPFSLLPGEPVLHQTGHRNLPAPEFLRRTFKLRLGSVPFPGLDIAVSPSGQHGRLARNPADSPDQLRHGIS